MILLSSFCVKFYVLVCRYQDYGVDGGEAAKSLSPKFDTVSKHFTTQTGLQVPDFEVRFCYSLSRHQITWTCVFLEFY